MEYQENGLPHRGACPSVGDKAQTPKEFPDVRLHKHRTMLDGVNKFHTHIIVNEMTAQRYKGKDGFGRAFRKACRRAGLERSLTFHDLRTTALTNMGNKGATMAEIVSFSGHKLNSPVLETYVKPGREAAKRALDKINTDD
jgi:integrase